MSAILRDHVERFNAAVRSGEWEPLMAGFADDAEMEFRGIPVGPFHGKDAITAAYRAQPPDNEMRVLEEQEREGCVEARYAWLAEQDVAAGEMLLTHEDGRIRKLVVTFDRGVAWS